MDSSTSLAFDSYFIPIIVVVVILAFVAMYLFMKRKAEGKDDSLLDKDSFSNGTTIVGLSGQYKGGEFPLTEPLIIGRTPECNVVFAEGTQGVSAVHCRVEFQGNNVMVTDLGSSYGTFLNNGLRLTPNIPQEIHAGDGFYLGDQSNQFQLR